MKVCAACAWTVVQVDFDGENWSSCAMCTPAFCGLGTYSFVFLGQTRGCHHVSLGSLCCGSMASEVEDGHDWEGEPQWTAGQFLPSSDLHVT